MQANGDPNVGYVIALFVIVGLLIFFAVAAYVQKRENDFRQMGLEELERELAWKTQYLTSGEAGAVFSCVDPDARAFGLAFVQSDVEMISRIIAEKKIEQAASAQA